MPGRPGAIPAVARARAGQIPRDVIPAGAAATPACEVRAVTDGIPDLPPGAAAIQEPTRRPAGRPFQAGSGGMGLAQGGAGGMGPPKGGLGGWVPPGAGSSGGSSPRVNTVNTAGSYAVGHDSARRHARRRGAGHRRTGRLPRAAEFSPAAKSGRPRRWGALQGGLGVCIIVASAAIGAVVTMVTRSAPGALLGLFVVAGTVAASLAIRPRAGRMIFPVPVLSYLVTALISGAVFDRSADSSKTALAIAAAQWIADGFFAMALATVLAVLITAARWYLWRRRRPATRDPGWPVPPAGPTRTGPARAGTVRPGTGRDGTVRGPGGPAGWGDPGSRGTGPPPTPRPGSEPYNFSSGA